MSQSYERNRLPFEQNEPNEEEERELELVMEQESRLDPKKWMRAIAYKRSMPRISSLAIRDPYRPLPDGLKENDLGVVVPRRRSGTIGLERCPNPDEYGSFGFVGVFAHLESNGRVDGTLHLKFDEKKLGLVARESLRLFRWDEKANRFKMLPGSGVNADFNYVSGRVTEGGTYAIIGLNMHPFAIRTVSIACQLTPITSLVSDEIRASIQERLCWVILCAPDLQGLMQDPKLVSDLVRQGMRGLPAMGEYWPEPGAIPVPGNLCDICIGNRQGYFPECEIITTPPGRTCLGWHTVGPIDLAGCIRQIVVDPSDSNRIYAAARNGGIWTLPGVDGYPSTSWIPLGDQLENLMMEAIAVAASDSNVLYAANRLGFLYRSDDLGQNWLRTSDTDHETVRRILVHPSQAQTVFIASSGGFRISTNAGQDWTELHGGDVTDAALDPADSSIIYIAVRNVGVLKTYTMGFGGWETIFDWADRDDPAHWMTKLALGTRHADNTIQTDADRTVVIKFGDEVWVNHRGGRDSGGDWSNKGKRGDSVQLWWNNCVGVDPFDPDIILAGGRWLDRTDDGGSTWSRVATFYRPHEDQQSIAFDARNNGVVYLANDGGVFRSADHGQTWWIEDESKADAIAAKRNLNLNLVTAEFYRVGVQRERSVGNLFHSGIIATSSLTGGRWGGIEGHAWEWNYVYADPKRPGRFYIFSGELRSRRHPGTGTDDLAVFGRFRPYRRGSGTSTPVGCIAVDTRPAAQVILVGAFNDAEAGEPYRLMMTVQGDNEPFRDSDGNWQNIPAWAAVIENGGVPIASVRFAASSPGMAYAIADDGQTFQIDDVNVPGAWGRPGRWNTGGSVRQLAVSPIEDDKLYAVTGSAVGRSSDGGMSWEEVGSATLPVSEFNSIITHPTDADTIYLGADSGVYISFDQGDSWSPFDDELPNAEILQIFWEEDFLYAVTHGRGMWRREHCF